jgi:hypothetical protein
MAANNAERRGEQAKNRRRAEIGRTSRLPAVKISRTRSVGTFGMELLKESRPRPRHFIGHLFHAEN